MIDSSNEVEREISNWMKIIFLLCKLNIRIEMSVIMLNSVSEAFGPLEHPMFSSSERQYKRVLVRRCIVSYHVFRSSE